MDSTALTDTIDFRALPRRRLDQMAEAGERIRECYRVLAKTGDNVVSEILPGQGEFFEWAHYPDGDVYDHETHAQYYYHTHPPEERSDSMGPEHGHFHAFLRPNGFPPGIRPAPVPDPAPPAGDNDALCHLIAISMDATGRPERLFATNRWVTEETWYAARDAVAMLDSFAVDMSYPSWPTNIWITEMIRLFRPQVELLLSARDRALEAWTQAHPEENPFEDRRLEVMAFLPISVDRQIDAVAKALRSATL